MSDRLLETRWLEFYRKIKDSSWPEIETQDDFINLPKSILEEIIFVHLGYKISESKKENHVHSLKNHSNTLDDNGTYFDMNPVLENNTIFLADKIQVHYDLSLDGGGTQFGQRYKHVLSSLYPGKVFTNCFEWCSGPGFIGFDLLSRGFCEKLYLADIYLPCLDSIKKTISMNHEQCHDRVFYHHSKSISDLPGHWKFDLIVSNPPHWNRGLNQMITLIEKSDRILNDNDWNLHNEFFQNITGHLLPGATILLQEQSYASGPEMFRPMIEKNGLKIVDCHWESSDPAFYYLEIQQQ